MFRPDSVRFLTSAVKVSQFLPPDRPEIAVSGRSNVGKSSLINLLTGRRDLAKVSKTPGKTRAVNFFGVDDRWRLVDLPGYGYARLSKREVEQWGRVIDTYLRDRPNLAGIIQLVDSRHNPTDRDLEMMTWLSRTGIPTIIALTKVDKINRNTRRVLPDQFRKRWVGRLDWPVVLTSAEKKEGREELLREVENLLEAAFSAGWNSPGPERGGITDEQVEVRNSSPEKPLKFQEQRVRKREKSGISRRRKRGR